MPNKKPTPLKITPAEKRAEAQVLAELPTGDKAIWKAVLEWALDIFVVILIMVVLRVFFITPFIVKGHSMDDSLHDGELIVVNKIGYSFGDVARGDIVVFVPPVPESEDYYIKRVIGLPGEVVRIENKKVYVCNDAHPDCFELEEDYLNSLNAGYTCNVRQNCPVANGEKDTAYERPDPAVDYTVPAESYFVLGDNRVGSFDSRYFVEKGGNTYVPRDAIEGRSWVELFYTSTEFKNSSWSEAFRKGIGKMAKYSTEPLVNFSKFGFTDRVDYGE